MSILTSILGFLGGPIVGNLLEAYKAKIAIDGDIDKARVDLAGKELLIQTREAELRSQERIALHGRPWEPVNIMLYALAFYIAKIYVYDAALGLGTSDPVGGNVGEWGMMIMAFAVGKRGIENVVRILKR